MASSERVQRASAAAASLSTEEREDLIAELILGLERDREPEPGYDEAWSAEIRRRVDAERQRRVEGRPPVAGATRYRSVARGTTPSLGLIVEVEAIEELLAAAAWYDDQREGLGTEFLSAVDDAIARIADAPLSLPRDRFDERARRAPVSWFRSGDYDVDLDTGDGAPALPPEARSQPRNLLKE